MPATPETNAFLAWFQTWGQVTYITFNVLYWVVVAAAAAYGVRQAKRYVDFVVGAASEAAAGDRVAVEEFVD